MRKVENRRVFKHIHVLVILLKFLSYIIPMHILARLTDIAYGYAPCLIPKLLNSVLKDI